ncbi:MAG: TerC family protein, partial [Candidatus Nanopelagicales bacterium]
ALMGLRQLFFLLKGFLTKLHHLNKGLAIILAFIGVKLVLEAIHATTEIPVPLIPVWFSLVFIVAVLSVTIVASLRTSPRE